MDNSRKKTFQEIDKLATAYGWSIEYISALEQEEVNQFLEVIYEREMEHYKMLSYITTLGINGKTLDDLGTKMTNVDVPKEDTEVVTEKQKRQEQNMVKLFQLLGAKSKTILKGIKQKKLEA